MKKLLTGGGMAAIWMVAGGVHAACGLPGTNALSVQSNSGQGNFSCANLASDGSVEDLAALGIATVARGMENKTAQWSIPNSLLDTDNNGLQDKTYKIFIVSTVNGGGGSSCNYLYDGGETLFGDNLGDQSGGQIKLADTLVCGDPTPVDVVEEEPEPDIITTVGQECAATYTYTDETSSLTLTQDLSIGLSVDPSETVQDTITVCANSEIGGLGEALGQVQCAPPPYVLKDTSTTCTTAPNALGELPLDTCAPVDYTQASEFEYCWYYENRVCEAGSTLAFCAGRTDGTFIPKTKKGSYDISIDVFDGSTCYTYFLYGRAYYHCF